MIFRYTSLKNVRASYATALLLSCARTNCRALRCYLPSGIAQCFEAWVDFLKLEVHNNYDSRFNVFHLLPIDIGNYFKIMIYFIMEIKMRFNSKNLKKLLLPTISFSKMAECPDKLQTGTQGIWNQHQKIIRLNNKNSQRRSCRTEKAVC